MNLHQFCMRCVCFLAIVSPVAALSSSFTIFWSTCTGPMCAGSVLDVAMLSGVTLRDRKDRRVFAPCGSNNRSSDKQTVFFPHVITS
jgi:hypothetical protein